MNWLNSPSITLQNVQYVMDQFDPTTCQLYQLRALSSSHDCKKSTLSQSILASSPPSRDRVKQLVTVTSQFSSSENFGVPVYFLSLPLSGFTDCLNPSGNWYGCPSLSRTFHISRLSIAVQ